MRKKNVRVKPAAARNSEVCTCGVGLLFPFACVFALSLVEAWLILSGVLPPLFSYSPGNILFGVARLAIIGYVGVISAKISLKKAAINGGLVGLGMTIVFCLASVIGRFYMNKAVFGMTATGNWGLLAVFGLVIIENILLGAIIAVAAGWILSKQK